MSFRITTTCAFAALLIGVQGCQLINNDHYYRVEGPSPKYRDIKSYIIEFDDDGYLRERAQLTRALAAMDQAAAEHRVLTLLFIHGWKHNAKPKDSNLRSFDLMARNIETDLNASKSGQEKQWQVVPIYVGWRGEQTIASWWNFPIGWTVQQLTFWGRKNASERVGRGELQVVLSQISSKWRNWRQSDSTRAYNTLVLAGHSFGGAALLTATLPWLVSNTRLPGDVSAAPADLIIALNPAIQAGALDQTVLSSTLALSSDGSPLTKLLVLDAQNDRARKYLFPIGRALDSPIGNSTSWRHWRAERQAAGRPDYQLGFLLDPLREGTVMQASSDIRSDTPLCGRYQTTDPRGRGKFKQLGLTPMQPGAKCRNSVMMIQTREGVINKHSDIWELASRDFLRQYVKEQQTQIESSVTNYLRTK